MITAGSIGLMPAPAGAAPLTCGATIVKSTKLVSNLVCSGNGIIIGADNITLDLKGYTISGSGSGVGVDVGGHRKVMVRNGTIRDFSIGVQLGEGSNNNELVVLILEYNDVGALAFDSYLNQIRYNTFRHNDAAGLLWESSNNNRAENNTFTDNGSDYYGGAGTAEWEGGGGCSSGAAVILSDSNYNRVHKSTISGSPVGILVCNSHGNQIDDNIAQWNGIGIQVTDSTGTLVKDNLPSQNFIGILLDSDFFGEESFLDDNPYGNEVRDNDANDNYGDGIRVENGAPGPILVRVNRTNGNDDDGIDVDNSDTTITGNVANNNGDWGIEGVSGVTDGGSNKGANNGEPMQCLNVFCKTTVPPP